MRIAIISDLHMSDRVDQIHQKIFSDLMQHLALLPIDFLIFLGDFLDSQRCSPELFRFLVKSLEPIRRGSIPIYFVLGDHEMSNPFRATPLIYFSELSGCKVIESVTGIDLHHESCLFLPSTVKDLNGLNSDHNAVFYHGFLQNVRVSKDYRMYRPSDFGIEDFLQSGAEYYFFGGIHKRQFFKIPDEYPEVKFAGYTGALTQRTFGDEGNPAGYLLWDSEKGVQAVDIIAPRFKTVRFSGQVFKVAEALKELELPDGQWNLKIILDSHFGSEDMRILRKIAEEKELLSLHFETKQEKKSVEGKSDQITLEDSPIAILGEWLKLKEVAVKKREIVLKRATDLRKNIAGKGK